LSEQLQVTGIKMLRSISKELFRSVHKQNFNETISTRAFSLPCK
jgi:hypothetical protein